MGFPTRGLIILILAISLTTGFFLYKNNLFKTSPVVSPTPSLQPSAPASPTTSPTSTFSPTPKPTSKPTPTPSKETFKNNQIACIDKTKLEVWYSQPFNDKTAEQAESYFQANNLTIVYPPQSNTKYVVQIPSNSSGEYWINKLASDGFGNVQYWRITGCDVVR